MANVMTLQGFVSHHEMLVSLLSAQLAGCLGTVQAQPLALGPRSASEGLTVGGRPQPILSPSALASLLLVAGRAARADPAAPRRRHRPAQRLVPAERQLGAAGVHRPATRSRSSRRAASPKACSARSPPSRTTAPTRRWPAALILFRMNVSPVISIHHSVRWRQPHRTALARESTETVAGVASIGKLWTQLNAAGLQDRVTFATINVFGRTLSAAKGNGRGRTHTATTT